jgi:dTDP-4-amino-4,6-dideoxygalactose transaminase
MAKSKLDAPLALKGGPKYVTEEIPGWPTFTEKIIQAATKPLRDGAPNYWTNRNGKLEGGKVGSYGMEYEEKFAKWNGNKHAISCCNGTAALHIALAGFDIGPGDEVIVPSYTFIASSMCVLQAGAIPVFADCDADNHTIDPKDIEKKITKRTKAIIPVHLYGCVADMDAIMKIARKHKLIVVEDCAEAHGSTWKGKQVGTIGHAGAFSFCQSKHWTTGGEGGMTVTNNTDASWIMRSFRDHGYDVKARMSLLEMEAHLPYIHTRLGFNYRMTEMQSCLGIEELKRFDKWNKPRRQKNHRILVKELDGLPGIKKINYEDKKRDCVFFLIPIILDIDALSCTVDEFTAALGAEGCPCGPVLWPQCYKEAVFCNHVGQGSNDFPFKSKEYTNPKSVKYKGMKMKNSVAYQESTFFTVAWPTCQPKHMRMIAGAIKKVLRANLK